MPGIGELMDGAMQHAPHPGRHGTSSWMRPVTAVIRCESWDRLGPMSTAVRTEPAAQAVLSQTCGIRYGKRIGRGGEHAVGKDETRRAMTQDWKQDIRREIEDIVARRHEERRTATRWLAPLVGFASAADPLFERSKQAVSPTHALPGDLLPGAKTVIVWFVPFEQSVAMSNIPGTAASREWATAYVETNVLLAAIGAGVVEFLRARGHSASAPPPTNQFDPTRLVSDWSHRHAAVAAGLGAFGHNNMLITEAGCCGRLGSLVTTLEVEPDARSGAEACLHRNGGSCLRCVCRCVNGALHEGWFDRFRCYEMCLRNGEVHSGLGRADVCGKCLVGVPCSFTDPVAAVGRAKTAGVPFTAPGQADPAS
jgi:epoxyqueuosine reductase QueG